MKNFKTILIVTLILDVIQFIHLVLAKIGGEMKNQMISDLNSEGLASSTPALEALDIKKFNYILIKKRLRRLFFLSVFFFVLINNLLI